jgi:hypothetical protein
VATTASTSWTSGVLGAPGDWKFGVRAFDPATGLEEANLDCAVEVVLDSAGKDVTSRPAAPLGLRAFASGSGTARVEWWCPPAPGAKAPTEFRVYRGIGSPSYAAPAAIVPYSSGFMGTFRATLSGLTGGTTYAVAVRARNASGEEANTNTVSVTAASAGPNPVDSLTASAV